MKQTDDRHERHREDKLPAAEIVIDSPSAQKADNFWYYNKWKVIIAAFVTLVLIVCIAQSCSREGYDTVLMYAGPYEGLSNKEIYTGVCAALNSVVPEDYNEDGSSTCNLVSLVIYSNDQIEQLRETAAAESRKLPINTELNAQELQKFDQLIVAGEYSVCLLDPTLYKRVKSAGGFCKLEDVLGYKPECANDDYSINFAETEFAKHFEMFGGLPADTLLCLRTKSTLGGVDSTKKYEISRQFFVNIVEFKP